MRLKKHGFSDRRLDHEKAETRDVSHIDPSERKKRE
jgi:hypothetical protein